MTLRRALVALGALLLLPGCESLSYYSQAVGGQFALLAAARPVEEMLGEPGTAPALRKRLAAAMAIREFASKQLALPRNGSYRRYADIGRPYVVWNVVAATEFSVKPVKSCFPFSGCVSYRGFFAKEDAERHAGSLRKAGNDIIVYGVPAYSTLGWFDDPLLSSFIRYPETELARLIFHELAHQVVYVKGDSKFNESFAVVVEQEGVRRWLARGGRSAEMAAFRESQARKQAFVALIGETRSRLERVYRDPLPPGEMRLRKAAEFDALRKRYAVLKAGWGGFSGYDRFFAAPNNALLASVATYTGRVPEFRRLFADAGGDFTAFYARVRLLAKDAKKPTP